jgi:acylphosphatase
MVMAQARLHAVIRGRVQGVAFRYATEDRANRLGAVGWVRNRRDGSVELLAEGEREKLEELAAWCRRGPSLARVDEVEIDWQEAEGEFSKFFIAHTA